MTETTDAHQPSGSKLWSSRAGFPWLVAWFFLAVFPAHAVITATILAGGETALPADTPSGRVDAEGKFVFVGALEVSNGSSTYKGSAVAISPEWLLTAGHNADLNDDGLPDSFWNSTFHLPEYGSFAVLEAFTHGSFTGFANPNVNDDLALLRLATPLPLGLGYPALGKGAGLGDVITLVGYGRSGYGSYGYTGNASLTDRRYGSNAINSFKLDDEGDGFNEVFLYDFDDPASPDSLGNAIETIIGPGDSGGPALRQSADGWEIVGISTFTEGYGGRFGDTGGGVLIEPYLGWIHETTGIPEPGSMLTMLLGAFLLVRRGQINR